MSESKINEAALNLVKSTRRASETIVASTLAAQERNIQLAQSVLESGIEAARRHAEDATKLSQAVAAQNQHPQAAAQAWLDSAVAAQERNVQFAQRVFEKGTAALKAHAEGMHTLTQQLFEQSQQQSEAMRAFAQESLNVTLSSFSFTTH